MAAILAGFPGFNSMSGTAAGIAKILFFIFVVRLLVSVISHLVSGKRF
jgi:uncharacterized membrane protein YtjA (UPF0391 family)